MTISKTLRISRLLSRMNCTESTIIFCMSIDHSGRKYSLKIYFSPPNYCLAHRFFFLKINIERLHHEKSNAYELFVIFFCFHAAIAIIKLARFRCAKWTYANAVIQIKNHEISKHERLVRQNENVCRHELGQVFFCDCILSILLLCSINIICFVYLLHTCMDCCWCWYQIDPVPNTNSMLNADNDYFRATPYAFERFSLNKTRKHPCTS